MEEQRKSQRYRLSEERRFAVMQNATTLGSLENVSRGGVSFYAAGDFKEGDRLQCTFELGGLQQPIPAVLEVVWRTPSADRILYGAKFVTIDPGDKFDILDVLYQDWRKSVVGNPTV